MLSAHYLFCHTTDIQSMVFIHNFTLTLIFVKVISHIIDTLTLRLCSLIYAKASHICTNITQEFRTMDIPISQGKVSYHMERLCYMYSFFDS